MKINPRGHRQTERTRKARCNAHVRPRTWRTGCCTARGEPPLFLCGGTRSHLNASSQPSRRGNGTGNPSALAPLLKPSRGAGTQAFRGAGKPQAFRGAGTSTRGRR
eukprot:12608954-Alexandrium_andersonii.AAC.1